MQILAAKTVPSADVLVVPILEGERADRGQLKAVDEMVAGQLTAAIASGELKGAYNAAALETALWPATGPVKRVLLIGAGSRKEADADRMRNVAGAAGRRLRTKYVTAAFLLRTDAHAEAVADGLITADFDPDVYSAKHAHTTLEAVTLVGENAGKLARNGMVIGQSVNLARTLANEPPNRKPPAVLAERFAAELADVGVEVEILEGDALARFGGINAVASGSINPPRLVSMTYAPRRARKEPVLGLVGKGVTFDSGGLSLKPSDSMATMKSDMAGAGAVVSALKAIATLKLPLRVHVVCPLAENMPSGTAMRVGDVLEMYSGKTVEVLNTDAEGRLVLGDALAWIAERGVTHLVDVATLTGGMEIALGTFTYGVMGRPDGFVSRVLAAARKGGEKAWQLPLYPEYGQQIVSDVADIKNTSGRPAQSITAAKFLEHFVPDDLPWAHLDIAGVDWGEAAPWRSKGPTGAAVRTLIRLARDLSG